MYGMLLESVQHFILEHYGEQKWREIMKRVDCPSLVFTTHKRYQDCLMLNLASACALVLGDRTQAEYLDYFGTCFVAFFSHYGYDKIVRLSGRYYRDFLHGIDNLHETMRFTFPKMLSPTFYVESETKSGCLLHYVSLRKGFSYYVIGQLRQCGRIFYNLDVDVRIVEEFNNDQGCHVVYGLRFDNSVYQDTRQTRVNINNIFPYVPLSTILKVSTLMTRFMGSTWGSSGADWTHVGPMLVPWTLLSG